MQRADRDRDLCRSAPGAGVGNGRERELQCEPLVHTVGAEAEGVIVLEERPILGVEVRAIVIEHDEVVLPCRLWCDRGLCKVPQVGGARARVRREGDDIFRRVRVKAVVITKVDIEARAGFHFAD